MTRLTGGLPMPRASTSPYEICIHQTEEPTRKITLRYIEDSNRRVIQPRVVEFADITNSSKMDVENKLRDAQRYVQNPSISDINSQLPNDQSNDESYHLQKILLPESFEEYASFTMSFIEKCVEKDSAILVPIITANADIATQFAWRFAREVDPDGLRTVGVLTKIDCVPIDDEKSIWNLKSVKPEESDDSLESDTIKKLRNHRTWKDVPINKFGIQNFVMKLIGLQAFLNLLKGKPSIRFLDVDEILKNLPHKPVENPSRILELIIKFDKVFTNNEYVDHKLYRGQQWNFSQFNQALLNARPIYKRRDQLNETVQESQGGLLDGHFPYRAVIYIVELHRLDWFSISVRLLDKSYDWVAQFINELINNTFEEFPNIIEGIKNILRDLLRKCNDETLDRLAVMEHISASRSRYVTDETSLLKKQSKYLTKLQNFAASSKQMNKELKAVLELGSELFDMMYYDENEEENNATRKNKYLDKLISVISIATGVLSYWKITYSKYRENVSHIVERYLVHQFAINLGIHLRTDLILLAAEQNTAIDNIKLESL
ncbi:4772_t:CDS:2 [Funneliformis caledonium]|uniref:4772_t:CDS:1 n=1 Tax=Funneliformis caledonium TaxID=1117310 RepID=A0A9N9AVS8_9GLOM|nr:4772_t:CDS:2 [Funneliformis caledonium]